MEFKETTMLTRETMIVGGVIRGILDGSNSLQTCYRIKAKILKWQTYKRGVSMMGVPLTTEEILVAKKLCLRLVQNPMRRELEASGCFGDCFG